MLNKLLERLNGHAADIDSLIAAKAQIDGELAAAKAELHDVQVRRHQALLDDASDQTLDKLEREIARKEVAIEKLSLAGPALQQRLDVARSKAETEARRGRENHHRGSFTAAYASFRAAILEADRMAAALIEARSVALRELGGDWAQEFPELMFKGFLGVNQAKAWVAESDRTIAAYQRSRALLPPEPAKPQSRQSQTATRPPESLQHVVSERPFVSIADPHRKRGKEHADPLPNENLREGEVLVRVLRSGYPDSAGRGSQQGRLISLPPEVARFAVENSAVEAIEMNVDRAQVQGADWQQIDPRTGVTSLGSGGTTITQLNPGAGTPAPSQEAAK